MATKPHDDDDDAKRRDAANQRGASTVTGAAAGADHETETTRVGANATSGGDMFGRSAEQRELMASNSIGAQIILDYNGDGSLGARGGAGGTIEENTMIRDAHLVAVGLDPNAPSGPPTGEPWVPPVTTMAAPRHSVSGHATRMSSLAAGVIAEPGDVPPPPAGSVTGAASR
jgi:hypothetical protein